MNDDLFLHVFDTLPMSAAVIDGEGRIVSVNAAWREFAACNGGPPSSTQQGNYLEVCRQAEDPGVQAVADDLAALLAGSRQSVSLEYPCHSPDRRRWFLMQASRVSTGDGGAAFAVICHTDITRRKLAEDAARDRAARDSLTGLLNRDSFLERLQQALERATRDGTRVAVLFVDLNDFKAVNDQLGHAAGDRLLAELGRRLGRSLRGTNAAARIGGDEFALLMEEATRERVLGLAERVRRLLDVDTGVNGQPVTSTGAIGISFYPDDGEDAEQLLKASDRAMYQAKRSGQPVMLTR